MKKTVLLFGILSLVFLFAFKQTQNPSDLWLEDFEVLKSQMTKTYSNLKSIVLEESMDLSRLNTKTISELKLAKTQEEAQLVIRRFLAKFKDGHLAASVIETTLSTDNTDDSGNYPMSTDSVSVALKKMGFQEFDVPNLKFDSVPGYIPLTTKNNSFQAGIIQTANGKIGTLKLPYFYNQGYWGTPFKVWTTYRDEFDGICDDDCQEKFNSILEKEFTKEFIERLEELKSENISKLLVDVTGNNGGSGWFEEIAHLLSAKKLDYMPNLFIKHEHWKEILEEDLNTIGNDLANDKLSASLKQKLLKLQHLVIGLVAKCESNCASIEVWSNNKIDCLDLLEHPYGSKLPFDIMTDPQFNLLQSKDLLTASRFRPFKTGIYSGPLYVVQDEQSASATERFTSLLQINNEATIIGRNSYGAGCGYSNGGITTTLENIGLTVKMPDCVRLRADGKNEVYGIKPDIRIYWRRFSDNAYRKGQILVETVFS
ncbi:S41 family peptidase [Muricauda sp. 2012CJ35-5]|uniref:S41 family peptidase n=1 Tax=Flagellimonas spongiicola TaxID=2942208 RepID=A0ABT0PVE1_9FLAO|nr:S41 family peptidase [Allomuricauda spongiicola]MCL6275360.1 S41 family peptidase [Allomuricauda spongiicola]